MQILLENGADAEISDTWSQTPLMYCMITQYYEIAELILTQCPEVADIGDKYGKSALHIAVQVGSEDCVKVMLQVGQGHVICRSVNTCTNKILIY